MQIDSDDDMPCLVQVPTTFELPPKSETPANYLKIKRTGVSANVSQRHTVNYGPEFSLKSVPQNYKIADGFSSRRRTGNDGRLVQKPSLPITYVHRSSVFYGRRTVEPTINPPTEIHLRPQPVDRRRRRHRLRLQRVSSNVDVSSDGDPDEVEVRQRSASLGRAHNTIRFVKHFVNKSASNLRLFVDSFSRIDRFDGDLSRKVSAQSLPEFGHELNRFECEFLKIEKFPKKFRTRNFY